MPKNFQTKRRIEFRDTDAAGIVHFSQFFVFMEQAEHEFWRELGISVFYETDEGTISWPRVSASCDYRKPAKFEEVIDISLVISKVGEKSISFQATFECDGHTIANGSATAVCCIVEHGKRPQSVSIPAAIRELLTPYLP